MISVAIAAFIATAIVAPCAWATPQRVEGQAVIIDGDTLDVGAVTIRLYGIDAAEDGQRCVSADRKFVRPGDQAAARLVALAHGGVRCIGNEIDDYGRLIAVCSNGAGQEINYALVLEGLAWAFIKYSTDYAGAEAVARNAKRGIWQLACEPPWEFRAKRWAVAVQKAPAGCPIKGNISENGRIYHTPWSRSYARTKIDTAKGERWFCNEQEAVNAGWRAPRR